MDDPEPIILFLLSGMGMSVNPFNADALILIAIVIVLLVISALISGSEVAYFSFSPAERDELNNRSDSKGRLITQLLNNPRRLLATILVVNNFVNIGVIILSTFALNLMFDFSNNLLFKFIFEVVLITAVLLFVGEVVPKVYATRNGMSLASLMAMPLNVLSKLFYPIIHLLIHSTSFIEKRIRWRGKSLSTEDLSKALELTSENKIQEEDQRILEGIVRFGNTDVKQIMVSRVDVVSLNEEADFQEVLAMINSSGYSRIPVYKKNFDKITGILYIKDILHHLEMNEDFEWSKLVRPPFFVPENKKIDDLLKEFQEKKIHLAIVVDEYGGTSGIVSLDDILEEIVGDISEEVEEENGFQKLDDNNYLFDGKTALIDFYKLIQVDEAEFENAKGESDTLAGFVVEISGRIPKKMEKIKFGKYLFTIESSNIKRVKEIKVTLLDE